MSISVQRVSILFAAAPVALFGAYFWYIFHHGELADKPYWAALQAIEYENRSAQDASPSLRTNIGGTGADAVGIGSHGTTGARVCVILNQTDSDGYPFVLPRGVPIKANCQQLERVVSSHEIDPAVRSLLFRNCSANG